VRRLATGALAPRAISRARQLLALRPQLRLEALALGERQVALALHRIALGTRRIALAPEPIPILRSAVRIALRALDEPR
jgi:hypothetical protein